MIVKGVTKKEIEGSLGLNTNVISNKIATEVFSMLRLINQWFEKWRFVRPILGRRNNREV